MAVQAVFQADFTQFNTGVKQAEQELARFGTTSVNTARAMTEMAAAASSGVPAGQAITASYRQFDGVLASAGVHIGPYVKGLEDISAAAGRTATQLGALGTAGAIAAAAFLGWKIGGMLNDWLGLSKAIDETLQSVFGYGPAVATAGAQQDVMNKAIKEGAAATINYTQAVKFLTEAQKDREARGKDFTADLAEAQRQVRGLTESEKAQIEIDIRAGATADELRRIYGLNALAVKELGLSNKVTADQVKNLTEAHDKATEAAKKRAAANQAGVELMEREGLALERQRLAAPDIAAADAAYADRKSKLIPMFSALVTSTNNAAASAATLAEQEKILAADYDATVKAAQDMATAHTEAGVAAETATQATVAGYAQVGQQVNLSLDSVRAMIALQQYAARANAAALQHTGLFQTSGFYESIANIPIPKFQSGVQNFSGGLAMVHEDELLVNLAKGTSVIPAGRGVGGGTVINNVFHLTDTASNLANQVSQIIMRSVRAGTQVGTA